MATYAYVAVDPTGRTVPGLIEVPSQRGALRRIKGMGLSRPM